MEPATLSALFQDLVEKFSSVQWNVNAIVGWTLIISAILFSACVQLFGEALTLKWTVKQAAGLGEKEPTSIKLRKFFFPVFTTNPNEEFKPYLPYWAPAGVGMVATLIAGFFIAVTDNVLNIFIGIALLAVALFGCYRLAMWQVKNNRW